MIVRFEPRAVADLKSIHRYIATDSPEAAGRMYDSLAGACRTLGDFPHVGRASSRRGLRELTTAPPYVVFYSVGRLVRIRRIVHGARLR